MFPDQTSQGIEAFHDHCGAVGPEKGLEPMVFTEYDSQNIGDLIGATIHGPDAPDFCSDLVRCPSVVDVERDSIR
jgi:hypothetical protein